jgi:hypothetical protein
MWMLDGTWQYWVRLIPPSAAGPAVVTWGYHHVDIMTLSQDNKLHHLLYQYGWGDPIRTDVEMPAGTLTAIARQPGTTDLFVTRNDGTVWHGFWPRKPAAVAAPPP